MITLQKEKEYIAFCHERAGSIPGPSFGERVNNPSPSYEAPFIKWIYRAIDAEAELKDLEAKAELAKQEIETAISKLEDEILQMILVYRYIDWLSWIEISNKVFWSIATVKRKHERAISELKFT